MDPLDYVISFLKQTEEFETARTLLKTFKKYAITPQQYDTLGRLFNDAKDYHEAIDCASKTLVMASNPHEMYASRANIAKMYNHLNDPKKSLQYTNTNLEVNPLDYDAKMEKVFSYYLLGDLDTSYTLTKEILSEETAPKEIRDRCRFNIGTYQIDEGNFKEGIRNFIDVGHKIGIWPNKPLENSWNGQTVEGATIVIIAQGGIGDEIINVRFMKHIKERGMDAVWVTGRQDIAQVFNRNGFHTVSSISDIEADNKLFCYSFYLPILLDLDKEDIDVGVYLKPDVKYLEKWEKILPEGKKIALRWSGNPLYEQDLHRSLSLTRYMEAFGNKENVTFISVQRDFGMEELSKYPQVFDTSKYLETLDDLIACLYWCDQTITSCTSIAHVAAASGVKTTVFPPIACYYTWLDSGNTWYGSHVSVHRQKKWKDWDFIDEVQLD